MSTPDDHAGAAARLERRLLRLAEVMPPDQFAQLMERLAWALDASLGGATDEDIELALKQMSNPGRA